MPRVEKDKFYFLFVVLIWVKDLKLLICGSVGYGRIEKIRFLQNYLRENGFNVIDQFQIEMMDYSEIKDFRDKSELAKMIVKNDLSFIEKCDAIIALCDEPSFGTAIEIYYAKNIGKTVIILNKQPQPSPWPIAY
ncbi:MAG: nucleoside 2-deoxyribosyltransferase [Candidatus Bathyarchaeia archaeon]